MNVAELLGFYQNNPPRDYSRPSEAVESVEKDEPLVTVEKVKAAMGSDTVTSKTLADRMGIKRTYASYVLAKYAKDGLVDNLGETLGHKGGRPKNLFKWRT